MLKHYAFHCAYLINGLHRLFICLNYFNNNNKTETNIHWIPSVCQIKHYSDEPNCIGEESWVIINDHTAHK